MGILDGKVAIVTGAGGGLGRAYALALSSEGAKLVVNDLGGSRDGTGQGEKMADLVVAEIKEAGGEAVANYASVSDMAAAETLLTDALEAFGQVDVLVNNAGILRDRALHNLTEEDWDAVIAVHLKGTFAVTQPVFRHMRREGSGVIINISSPTGLIGNFGQSNYGAAKGGIWGFTNNLAIEGNSKGVRAFTVVPVAFTRMTEDLPGFQNEGAKEQIAPELVAPMVVYLASDLSAGMTGNAFSVVGGKIQEMKMVTSEGATKTQDGGLWTPEEIGEQIVDILFSEEETAQSS